VAAAGIAALVMFFIFFSSSLFGKSNRVVVHRAQGKAEFDGAAIPNAVICLYPVELKLKDCAPPQGTVKPDGTFVLGTYGKDDGAPAGEYKVTVQWFEKLDFKDLELGRKPKNLLPPKYASAETSGLIVRIEKGENHIPAIMLER
jgi:hypothetical protein